MASIVALTKGATQVVQDLQGIFDGKPILKYAVPSVATGATLYFASRVLWTGKRPPFWEWDLNAGMQTKQWTVYGEHFHKNHHAILGVVGVWGSGKTYVQRIFGAKIAPKKNRGIYATTIPGAVVVESLGRGAPLTDKKLAIDEQELTARFAADIVTEISHGVLLVIGDSMGLEDFRLLEEMKDKCIRLTIPLYVWHNIRTNPLATFRQRIKILYPNDEVDYTGCFDAPDVCHLMGGFRAKTRIDLVLHGLRAAAGATPSVGTLVDKVTNACSTILPRFFGGVAIPNADSKMDDAGSDGSAGESHFNMHLVFKKSGEHRKRKHWWAAKNELLGHFEIEAEDYSEPLELRSLYGCRGLSTGWIPACCVFETTDPNGRVVKNVELEAPGVLFEDVEVQTTKTGIKVSMKKHLPYHDTFRTKIDEDGRTYGLFVRNFSFHEKDAIFQPIPPPEGLSMKDGVLSLRLWKVDMNKVVKKRSPASLAERSRLTSLPSDSSSYCTPDQSRGTLLDQSNRGTLLGDRGDFRGFGSG